jgi:FkbM family methyltransferase
MLSTAYHAGRVASRHYDSRLVRIVDGIVGAFHRGYENFDYDIDSNGEGRVLQVLARYGITRILDVGANEGDWTLAAHKACPEGEIHAFEVAPATFAKLSRRVASALPAVTVNMVGLAGTNGRMQLKYVEQNDRWSSGVEVLAKVPSVVIDVDVITGDAYCQRRDIDSIDLLKLDVEGMEDQVLDGFSRMLAARKIRVIQFEYGLVNIAAHVLLRDFYDRLTVYGYAIGKIYPRCVNFREYQWAHEDFIGPNFLAVLATERELIDRLSATTTARGARRTRFS